MRSERWSRLYACPRVIALQAVTLFLQTANLQMRTVENVVLFTCCCTSVQVMPSAPSLSVAMHLLCGHGVQPCHGWRCKGTFEESLTCRGLQDRFPWALRPTVCREGVRPLPLYCHGRRRRRCHGTSSAFETVIEGAARRPGPSPRSRGALNVRRGKTHRTGRRGGDTYATGTAVVVVGCGRGE